VRLTDCDRLTDGYERDGEIFRHTPGDLGVGFTGLHSICLAFLWLGLFMMGEWDGLGLRLGDYFLESLCFWMDGCSQGGGGEREREHCTSMCGYMWEQPFGERELSTTKAGPLV
jgi:hypothetical protein